MTLTTILEWLDEAGFAEAWEQGRKLTLDEVVASSPGEVEPDA